VAERQCDGCGENFAFPGVGMVNGVKTFVTKTPIGKPNVTPDLVQFRIDHGFDLCGECSRAYMIKCLQDEYKLTSSEVLSALEEDIKDA